MRRGICSPNSNLNSHHWPVFSERIVSWRLFGVQASAFSSAKWGLILPYLLSKIGQTPTPFRLAVGGRHVLLEHALYCGAVSLGQRSQEGQGASSDG
mgnify:CR=1 FL=1